MNQKFFFAAAAPAICASHLSSNIINSLSFLCVGSDGGFAHRRTIDKVRRSEIVEAR